MIFGKDLGRSAFFAEIGSEVERLDSIQQLHEPRLHRAERQSHRHRRAGVSH